MSPLDPDRIAAAHRVAATAVGSPGLQRLADLAGVLRAGANPRGMQGYAVGR